jgi:hypothetical protein
MRTYSVSEIARKTFGGKGDAGPGIVVVDILPYLEAAAYIGFIAGAIFAVLELRGLKQDRSTELVMRMNEFTCSRDFEDTIARFMKARFKTAKEAEEQLSTADLMMIADYFDGIGYLAKRKLIPADIIVGILPSDYVWDKIKPWADEEEVDDPERVKYGSSYPYAKWLAEETRRRRLADEQKGKSRLSPNRKRP